MVESIATKKILEQALAFRAEFDRVTAEATAMRTELDAADTAYKEGVNSIYEPGTE